MIHGEPKRVPAIVVSGFLGSGKTSLVRALLEDARRRAVRAAVVSNEFGALGIDSALLAGGAEAIIELEGGCVCCQLSNDLLETIVRLRTEVDPDLFIVETSGLALASETLLSFWRDPVRDWISDDIGVVVVNAEQVWEKRDLHGSFEDQLGAADLIVLNKIDLVPDDALPGIEATVREIEPQAPIVRTAHGRIDPIVLLPPAASERALRVREPPPDATTHNHDRFRSVVIDVPAGIAAEEVVRRVRAGAPIRAKGFIETRDGVQLLQLVGDRVELSPPPSPAPRDLVGKVVVIGRCARDQPA